MHGPADLKSEQRAHLGLDALEEIISGQSHGNANCGLDQAHKGKSIAGRRIALALSHCSLPSINATAGPTINHQQHAATPREAMLHFDRHFQGILD